MAIDYVGLNQALSSNSGLLGTAANFMARNQDREMYRDQFDKDFSLRSRALGFEQQKHQDQYTLDQNKFDHQKDVDLQKLEVFKQNSLAARDLLKIEARIKRGEATKQEHEFAQQKKKDLDEVTAKYAQGYNSAKASKGFVKPDGKGGVVFDANAAIQDDEVFSKSLILANSPYNQNAVGSLKEDDNDPTSFIEAVRVQKPDGSWVVRIGVDGETPDEVSPEQYFQQIETLAAQSSPEALNQQNVLQTVAAHGHANQPFLLALNSNGMSDDQKRLAEGKTSLSEATKTQEKMHAEDPSLKTAQMEQRDTQERIGAGRIDQVIDGLFKEYEDDFDSQGDLKQKMLQVYGANPHELAELGLDKELRDYSREDIKALAEYTRVAAKGKENRFVEMFRNYHPVGIGLDKFGLLPRKKNSTISEDEFSQIKTLRQAKGY